MAGAAIKNTCEDIPTVELHHRYFSRILTSGAKQLFCHGISILCFFRCYILTQQTTKNNLPNCKDASSEMTRAFRTKNYRMMMRIALMN